MNAQRIRFSLCTLCLHLTVLWLFWQGSPFEHGAARSQKSFEVAFPVLEVGIVPSQKAQPTIPPQNPAETTSSKGRKDSIEKISASPPSRAFETTDLFTDPESPGETIKNDLPPELNPNMMIAQDYFPAGRLTRLPAPRGDIDLNVPAINDIAYAGQIELSVLIDDNGIVADVLTSMETESESMHLFADRVAERFKSARFIPGEINGKAVKSRLQITVVSENLPSSEN